MIILFVLAFQLAAQSVTVVYDHNGRVDGTTRGPSGYGGVLQIRGFGGSWTIDTACSGLVVFSSRTGSGDADVRFVRKLAGIAVSAGVDDSAANCTGSVSGVGFTILGRVHRQLPPFVTDMNGNVSWAGYTKSNNSHWYTNQGNSTNSYPPADGVNLPAVGATWTDPTFGGVWRRLVAKHMVPYANGRISLDGTHAVTSDGVFRLSDGTRIGDAPYVTGANQVCSGSGATDGATFFGFADGGHYGFCASNTDRTLIRKWSLNVGTGAITEVQAPGGGAWYTHHEEIQNEGLGISIGGTGSVIAVDDRIFIPSTNQVCMVNLRTRVREACADLQAISIGTATFDAGTDIVTVSGHGLAGNDSAVQVKFTNSGGSMPGGVTSGARYFIKTVTSNTFQLSSENAFGATLNITSNGSGTTTLYQLRTVRQTQISSRDDADGSRMMGYYSNKPHNYMFPVRYRAGALTFLPAANTSDRNISDGGPGWMGPPCIPGTDCWSDGHNSIYWDRGTTRMVGNNVGGIQSGDYIFGLPIAGLSAAAHGGLIAEAGGGYVGQSAHNGNYALAAVDAPVVLWTGSGQVETRGLTGCSGNGTTVTCTVAAPVNLSGSPIWGSTNIYAVSDRVIVKTSVSQWNGFQTLTASSGSSISFASATSGSQSGDAWITKAVRVDDGNSNYNRGILVACRTDNWHCRLIAKLNCDGTNDSYFQLTHGVLSPHGESALINNGFCWPGEYGTWHVKTGFEDLDSRVTAAHFTKSSRIFFDRGGAGELVLRVMAPKAAGSCTAEFSATRDWAMITDTASLTGGTALRTHTLTGLSAGAKRYVRVYCTGTNPYGSVVPRWYYAIADAVAN